jgi:hypothetical protein
MALRNSSLLETIVAIADALEKLRRDADSVEIASQPSRNLPQNLVREPLLNQPWVLRVDRKAEHDRGTLLRSHVSGLDRSRAERVQVLEQLSLGIGSSRERLIDVIDGVARGPLRRLDLRLCRVGDDLLLLQLSLRGHVCGPVELPVRVSATLGNLLFLPLDSLQRTKLFLSGLCSLEVILFASRLNGLPLERNLVLDRLEIFSGFLASLERLLCGLGLGTLATAVEVEQELIDPLIGRNLLLELSVKLRLAGLGLAAPPRSCAGSPPRLRRRPSTRCLPVPAPGRGRCLLAVAGQPLRLRCRIGRPCR